MAPLRLAGLLCWALLAGATLYRKEAPSLGAGSELARVAADSVLQCALHCQLAGDGDACVGFHRSAAVCRLLSGLYPRLAGTYVRQPPPRYTACGRAAYRVYPPMARDEAKAACAAAGGRMAIPVTAEERACVHQLVKEAGATPGFNPDNVDSDNIAFLGVLLHGPGPDYSIADLNNQPLTLPAEVWASDQPDDNRELSFTVIVNRQYNDWHPWGILMHVCEVKTD